jgi:hypothetical protein
MEAGTTKAWIKARRIKLIEKPISGKVVITMAGHSSRY